MWKPEREKTMYKVACDAEEDCCSDYSVQLFRPIAYTDSPYTVFDVHTCKFTVDRLG